MSLLAGPRAPPPRRLTHGRKVKPHPAGDDAASNALFGLTIVVTVVCLPFISWILISAINPEFGDLPRPDRIAMVGAVVAFAVVGDGRPRHLMFRRPVP